MAPALLSRPEWAVLLGVRNPRPGPKAPLTAIRNVTQARRPGFAVVDLPRISPAATLIHRGQCREAHTRP